MEEEQTQPTTATTTTTTSEGEGEKDLFPDLGEEERPTEIESLCVNCEENGLTKILLVNIPFFKEIIVSAFECPHCHYTNNEVQSAGQIAEKGCEYTLRVTKPEDFNRSIVKTETCSFRIEDLDFEIPAGTQKGMFTNLEGIITRARDGLQQDQPLRKIQMPEVAEQIDAFITKLNCLLEGMSFPFTIKLNDICGNSFIQNIYAPKIDPYLKVHHYIRSSEQDLSLGIRPQDYGPAAFNNNNNTTPQTDDDENTTHTHSSAAERIITNIDVDQLKKKIEEYTEAEDSQSIMEMPCECTSCFYPGTIRMHILNIPYFKEIVIMAFTCDRCGFRTNEVKAGGAISDHGRKYELRVKSELDMNRDLLKSDTAVVEVPELELHLAAGSLGGKFTTVEGLLKQIRDQLVKNPFILGDSTRNEDVSNLQSFISKFDSLLEGKDEFTLILDDPVGNSYVQNIYAPDPDPFLVVTDYIRTDEQNEELGLNDMITEGYYHEEDDHHHKEEEEKQNAVLDDDASKHQSTLEGEAALSSSSSSQPQ